MSHRKKQTAWGRLMAALGVERIASLGETGETRPLLPSFSGSDEEDSSTSDPLYARKLEQPSGAAFAAAPHAVRTGSRSPRVEEAEEDAVEKLEEMPRLLTRAVTAFTLAVCASAVMGTMKTALIRRMPVVTSMLPVGIAFVWFAIELALSVTTARRVMMREDAQRRKAFSSVRAAQRRLQQRQRQREGRRRRRRRREGEEEEQDDTFLPNTGSSSPSSSSSLSLSSSSDAFRVEPGRRTPDPAATTAEGESRRYLARSSRQRSLFTSSPPAVTPPAVTPRRRRSQGYTSLADTASVGAGSSPTTSSVDESPADRGDAKAVVEGARRYPRSHQQRGVGGGMIKTKEAITTEALAFEGQPQVAQESGMVPSSTIPSRQVRSAAARKESDAVANADEKYSKSREEKSFMTTAPLQGEQRQRQRWRQDDEKDEIDDDEDKEFVARKQRAIYARAVRVSFLLQSNVRLWLAMLGFAIVVGLVVILLLLRLLGVPADNLSTGLIASPALVALVFLILHSFIMLDGSGGKVGSAAVRGGDARTSLALGRRPVLILAFICVCTLALKLNSAERISYGLSVSSLARLAAGLPWQYVLCPVWILAALLEGVYLRVLLESWAGRRLLSGWYLGCGGGCDSGDDRETRSTGSSISSVCCCFSCFKSYSYEDDADKRKAETFWDGREESDRAPPSDLSSSSSSARSPRDARTRRSQEDLPRVRGYLPSLSSPAFFTKRDRETKMSEKDADTVEAATAMAEQGPIVSIPSFSTPIQWRAELTRTQRAAAAHFVGGVLCVTLSLIAVTLRYDGKDQSSWGVPATMTIAAAGVGLVGGGLRRLAQEYCDEMRGPMPPEFTPVPVVYSPQQGGWVFAPMKNPTVTMFLLGEVRLRQERMPAQGSAVDRGRWGSGVKDVLIGTGFEGL